MAARERGLNRQRLDKKRSVIQCQLPREIKAATGSGGVHARNFGEDDDVVDGARLSANRAKGKWGPIVSDLLGVSTRAREREREVARVG